MRTKPKPLIKQSNISIGRYIAVSALASVVSNALVFVHAGLSVVNIVLAIALCVIYFKCPCCLCFLLRSVLREDWTGMSWRRPCKE